MDYLYPHIYSDSILWEMSVVASGQLWCQSTWLNSCMCCTCCLDIWWPASHSSKTEGIQEWPRAIVPAPDNAGFQPGVQLTFGCGMVNKHKWSGRVASKHWGSVCRWQSAQRDRNAWNVNMHSLLCVEKQLSSVTEQLQWAVGDCGLWSVRSKKQWSCGAVSEWVCVVNEKKVWKNRATDLFRPSWMSL